MPVWWSVGEATPEGRFLGLSIVLFLAVAVPFLFSRLRRIRIPVVVGEVLAGMVVGVSGLQWVSPEDPFLRLLAEIGFVILMFLAGLELDVRMLGWGTQAAKARSRVANNARENGPSPLRMAWMHYFLTLALAHAATFLLWRMGLINNFLFVALVISTTSLDVVMLVLKERGLLGSRYGQTLLVTALIADFASIFLITIQVAILSQGLTFEILLVGVLFVVVFGLYRLGLLVLPGLRPLAEELSHATTQIHIRLAFLLLVAFVALSELLGAEIILGAFLAGLLVSLLTEGEETALKHQLESIGYGFFVPIFYIMVGVKFDLRVLLESSEALLLVVALIGVAFLNKVLPALAFVRAFSLHESLSGGVLLASRLTLLIAAAEIGREINVLNDAAVMALIVVALVTVTFAPMAFTYLVRGYTRPEKPPILIAGAGVIGIQMAQQLQGHGTRVVLLDDDPQRVEEARRKGLEAHHVRLTPSAVAPFFEGAHTLILASSDPERTLEWARLARQEFGIERVLALNANAGTRKVLQDMGVHCISPLEAQATFMVLMARNPDLLFLLTSTQDNRDVLEIPIRNPALDNKRLRELDLPPNALVLAVHRGGEYLIPRGDTRIRVGDVLTILGTLEDLEEVQARLGPAQV